MALCPLTNMYILTFPFTFPFDEILANNLLQQCHNGRHVYGNNNIDDDDDYDYADE